MEPKERINQIEQAVVTPDDIERAKARMEAVADYQEMPFSAALAVEIKESIAECCIFQKVGPVLIGLFRGEPKTIPGSLEDLILEMEVAKKTLLHLIKPSSVLLDK